MADLPANTVVPRAAGGERRVFGPVAAEPLALAFEDELTGLPNRRYLATLLREHWADIAGRCAPLSVLMIDLDGFKQVNDRYGHLVGDQVLATAAALLRQAFRSADLVIRYGGDEFVVVLPNLALEEAAALALRVREQFRRHGFRSAAGEPVAAPLSFSFGLATLPADAAEGGALLALADQRLYTEKRERRAIATGTVPRSGSALVSSVAVLPLRNLSLDATPDYVAEGMTEELIVALARCRDLRVLSRSAVMRYRDGLTPLSQIAAELGVEALVEGSVRCAGERVRISVQLVDGLSEATRWADCVDGQIEALFDLQHEVAHRVVSHLRPQPTAIRPAPAGDEPSQARVYEAYLRGRHHWNRLTIESLARALDCFAEAVALQPNHGPSLAASADCQVALQFLGVPAASLAPAARLAAERAVAVAPGLAAAHAALATVRFFFDWDWPAANTAFSQALVLDPQSPTTRQSQAYLLSALGLHDAAIAGIRFARERDPLGLMVNVDLGWRLYFARRHAQAVRQLRLTLELDASFANAHWCLGGALLELGEQDAAICSLQRAVALSPDSPQPLGSLALALARGGRPEAAHDVLGRIETLCQDSSTVCWLRAIVLAGLGERAAALDALEQAHVARTPAMVWLSVHPELDALRGEPRFVALCRRMGLSAGIA